MIDIQERLPWSDWYVGWRLVPAPTAEHIPGPDFPCQFITSGVLGGVSVNHPDHKWSTRFTYPHDWDFIGCHFLACGCQISFSRNLVRHTSVVMIPDSGVITAELAEGADLAFFSLEHTYRAFGDRLTADLGKTRILQLRKRLQGKTRFVLIVSREDAETQTKRAEQYLELDVEQLWNRELLRRKPTLEALSPSSSEVFFFAGECFRAAESQPTGRFQHRWLNSGSADRPGFHTNLLLPVIDFEIPADAALAWELLLSAFDFQDEKGAIPAFCQVEGMARSKAMCWPIICQASADFLALPAFSNRLAELFPRLEKFAAWALSYFHRSDRKIPAWNNAEESFIPEVHTAGQFTPCTASLLITEVKALERIARHTGLEITAFDSKQVLQDLEQALTNFFWDPRSRSFTGRMRNGERAPFHTLSDLLPLITPALDETHRAPLKRMLEDPSGFNNPMGMLLWVDEKGDPDLAPAASLQTYVLFRHLDRDKDVTGLPSIARNMLNRIEKEFEGQVGLPGDLRYIFHHSLESSDSPSAATNLATAGLMLLLADLRKRAPTPLEEAPATVAIMEEHRKLTSTAIIILLAITVCVITGVFILKTRLTGSQFEALSGIAIRLYESGDFEKAVTAYSDLVRTTDGDNQRLMKERLASCYLKLDRFEEAEALLRVLHNENFRTPKMYLNYGLALFKVGKLEEAEQIYEEMIALYSEANPEFAFRAKTALAVLRKEKLP